jgi:hypothetical protein
LSYLSEQSQQLTDVALELAKKISCDPVFVEEISGMENVKEKFLYLFGKFSDLGYENVDGTLFADTVNYLEKNHDIDMGLGDLALEVDKTSKRFH